MEGVEVDTANLYASIGEQLVHYEVDVADAVLTPRGVITLPANIQYAWPHPSRHYLYVASSDRVRGEAGEKHSLSTFRIASDGTLEQIDRALSLPYRPIHITVDRAGRWLAATFNSAGAKRGPGTVLLYRILQGGAALEAASPEIVDAGMYPHQARFTSRNEHLLVCVRGNNATTERGEDLGSLKTFHVRNGSLAIGSEVQYEPGLGPRHLDLHPTGPWVYVSMERGNKLCVHRLDESGTVVPRILFTRSTLTDDANGKRTRQLASAIHTHPAGTHVYVANRADGIVRDGGDEVFEGGENTIAVYRIDQETGEPSILQHADTRGIHPRTFSIDRTGRLLVVGHMMSRRVRDDGAVKTAPVSLSVFRIAPDGRLEFARKYDIDTGKKTLFWMGIV
jgi:6-phosphogluconolactonase